MHAKVSSTHLIWVTSFWQAPSWQARYPLGMGIGGNTQVYSEQWFSGHYTPIVAVKTPLAYRAVPSYSG